MCLKCFPLTFRNCHPVSNETGPRNVNICPRVQLLRHMVNPATRWKLTQPAVVFAHRQTFTLHLNRTHLLIPAPYSDFLLENTCSQTDQLIDCADLSPLTKRTVLK